jgi:phosphoribosylformimino-5-aminoimidazole carboxamide ribotide isomerase
MLILPAIDIHEGKCIRLTKGDFANQTVYAEHPEEVARRFVEAGLQFVHVVDLEGAKAGAIRNWKALEALHGIAGIRTEVGGGIRHTDDLRRLFDLGVTRVVIGSLAIERPLHVKEWIREFGADRIVVAVDVREGSVRYKGWLEDSGRSPITFCMELTNIGVSHVLCTDVNRDGMLAGPNVELYRELKVVFPHIDLIASGGISSLADIRAVRDAGCSAAVVGKALYEGKLSLRELASWMQKGES